MLGLSGSAEERYRNDDTARAVDTVQSHRLEFLFQNDVTMHKNARGGNNYNHSFKT